MSEMSLQHLAVAPDGNGRWARLRGLQPHEGHLAGLMPIVETIQECINRSIPFVTFQIFTTENWGREQGEVDNLFEAIEGKLDFVHEQAIRLDAAIRWIGRRDRVPVTLKQHVEAIELATQSNSAITVSFCMDYGSYHEMTEVMKSIAEDAAAGKHLSFDKDLIDSRLQTAGIPDVDLYIRTSGEQRFSNYLLWQSGYAEMFFLDVLWPDFSLRHLGQAFEHYATRHRRFGAARYPKNS